MKDTLKRVSKNIDLLQSSPDSNEVKGCIEYIHGVWQQCPHSLEDILELKQLLDMVYSKSQNKIQSLLKEIHILVPSNLFKRGKKKVNDKIKQDFNKDHVRKALKKNYYNKVTAGSYGLTTPISREKVEKAIEATSFDAALWVAACILDDKASIQFFEEHYPIEYALELHQLYCFYIDECQQQMQVEPKEIRSIIDPRIHAKENKKLAVKLEIAEKKERKLKQAKKQLEQEYYELYDDALKEIEGMKQKIQKMEEDFTMERNYFLAEIESLRKRINEEVDSDEQQPPISLEGSSICLIGGERKREFEDIVKKYKGDLHFIPSSNHFFKISSSIMKSKAVFFLTEHVGHIHYKKAKKVAKKYEIPFIYVNSLGSRTFEDKLVGFMEGKTINEPECLSK